MLMYMQYLSIFPWSNAGVVLEQTIEDDIEEQQVMAT